MIWRRDLVPAGRNGAPVVAARQRRPRYWLSPGRKRVVISSASMTRRGDQPHRARRREYREVMGLAVGFTGKRRNSQAPSKPACRALARRGAVLVTNIAST